MLYLNNNYAYYKKIIMLILKNPENSEKYQKVEGENHL